MKEEEFRSWLATHRNLSERTIGSRVSNCRTVERHEGDLDNQFDQDKLQEQVRRLTYSTRDEVANKPALHSIPINGNVYNGTATLRSAVSLYKQFREQGHEDSATPIAMSRHPKSSRTRTTNNFRDFFLQFVSDKAISRDTIFTEAEVLAWFKATHPERTRQHIRDQLLKKSTNYMGRVHFIPPPTPSDDLFFALDYDFRTFRLYRQNDDPPPIYRKEEPVDIQSLRTNEETLVDGLPPVSEYSNQNNPVSPGAVLQSRYRIIRKLGQGGMGAVYEAVDQRLDCLVALKEATLPGDEARRAFHREASLLANLRHRSLPNVMDHFSEGDGQFLVMEFIPGEDLARKLKRNGRFETADVLRWGDFLLRTLEYLHARNPPILHRDIKPANLKLTEDDELFLLDFGLAKGRLGQMETMLTTRSIFGHTPVYSPLEQIIARGTDERSDLYAVGATLYHLLTDTAPIDAATRYTAIEERRDDPLRALHKMNSEVTENLSDVIMKAMAISRNQRWSSATEMRRALGSALDLTRRDTPGSLSETRGAASVEDETRIQRAAQYGIEDRADPILFNNCQGKDHAKIYGNGAFFDLWATDRRATNLDEGQPCVVVTKAEYDNLQFTSYAFIREEPADFEGRAVRVFYGELRDVQTLSKEEAAHTQPYSTFFDINGNFKRQSVLDKRIASATNGQQQSTSADKPSVNQSHSSSPPVAFTKDSEALTRVMSDADVRQFWIVLWGDPTHSTDEDEQVFNAGNYQHGFPRNPSGIRVGDILFVHRIGVSKIMYVGETLTLPREANASDKEWWRERWKWSVTTENLTPEYGAHWRERGQKTFALVKRYNELNRDQQVSISGLKYGRHVRIPKDFADFLMKEIVSVG